MAETVESIIVFFKLPLEHFGCRLSHILVHDLLIHATEGDHAVRMTIRW